MIKASIPFEREKKDAVNYKGIILPHHFYADFVIFDKIILEVKGIKGISDEFVAQAINYLKVSGNLLALYEWTDLMPRQKLVMRMAEGPFPMETTYTWVAVNDKTTKMT